MTGTLSQTALHILAITIGSIFAFPFIGNSKPIITISFGWFVGWGIISFSSIIIIISGNELIAPVVILIAFIISFLPNHFFYGFNKFINRIKNINVNSLFIYFSLVVLLIILVVIYGNNIRYSSDSSQYEAASYIFQKFGEYNSLTPGYEKWLFDLRLPLFVAANSIAMQMGVEIFYSFTPLATVFTILAMYGVFELSSTHKNGYIIWATLMSAVLISSVMIRFHTFYFHTNLITMGYYTLGTLSIGLYLQNKETGWFMAGMLLLGLSSLIRKEMYIMSLFPIIYLWAINSSPCFVKRFYGFCLYAGIPFLWTVYGIYVVPEQPNYIDLAVNKHEGHGSVLIPFVSFLCALSIFFIPFKAGSYRRYLLLGTVIICLSYLAFFLTDIFFIRLKELYKLFFHYQSVWTITWHLISYVFIWYLLFRSKLISFYPTIQRLCINDSFLNLITVVILLYLSVWLGIFTMSEAIASHWGGSGNRLLLHIFPLAIYFVCRLGYLLMFDENESGV
jgi:hypothetical protein